MLRTRAYAADRHTPDRLLQAFIDDELDPAVAARVRRHLSDCDDCRDDAVAYRLVCSAIARLGLAGDPVVLARLHRLVDELSASRDAS